MPSTSELVIRPLRLEDEAQARDAHREMAREGFDFLLGPDLPFDQLLQHLEREERGIDLAPGRVACTLRVATLDERIVGRVSVRHELNDFLLEVGGHVGYGVLRQWRGRGIATALLRWGLQYLRDLQVERALVTCDDDNIASARTIERCGGVLEDVREVPGGAAKRRYWIDLGTGR